MSKSQPALLVIGPEPPPITGMELATRALVCALDERGIPYYRVDTADPDDELGNRGSWTLHNIRLALEHLARCVLHSTRRDVRAVYLPIAQDFPGLARDIAFLLAARFARKPIVVHLHGGSFERFYGAQGLHVRRLLDATVGRASLGIVLTDGLRPALECVLPPERVVVVANGVEAPAEPAPSVPADDDVHVLFLSSLFRWKGPFVFIEAVARARVEVPSLRATVAGDWPTPALRQEAHRLVDGLGIAQVVSFPGAVDGEPKRALFQAADIFCFASLVSEGQPLVILEAMGAGLPVVAPAQPGIADTIVDGESGLLVSESSASALADAIVALARDPERRQALGTSARARFLAHYTRDRYGERMIETLSPLLTASDS